MITVNNRGMLDTNISPKYKVNKFSIIINKLENNFIGNIKDYEDFKNKSIVLKILLNKTHRKFEVSLSELNNINYNDKLNLISTINGIKQIIGIKVLKEYDNVYDKKITNLLYSEINTIMDKILNHILS